MLDTQKRLFKIPKRMSHNQKGYKPFAPALTPHVFVLILFSWLELTKSCCRLPMTSLRRASPSSSPPFQRSFRNSRVRPSGRICATRHGGILRELWSSNCGAATSTSSGSLTIRGLTIQSGSRQATTLARERSNRAGCPQRKVFPSELCLAYAHRFSPFYRSFVVGLAIVRHEPSGSDG